MPYTAVRLVVPLPCMVVTHADGEIRAGAKTSVGLHVLQSNQEYALLLAVLTSTQRGRLQSAIQRCPMLSCSIARTVHCRCLNRCRVTGPFLSRPLPLTLVLACSGHNCTGLFLWLLYFLCFSLVALLSLLFFGCVSLVARTVTATARSDGLIAAAAVAASARSMSAGSSCSCCSTAHHITGNR